MDIDDLHTPVGEEASTEHTPPTQSINDRSISPVIPAEDTFFNSTLSINPNPFSNLQHLALTLNNKRRAATQNFCGAGAGWIDQDTSGTYDPRKDRATPPVTPPPRKRRLVNVFEDHGKGSDGEELPSRPRRRPVGYSQVVVCVFTTQKGLDFLASLAEGGIFKEEKSVSTIEREENNTFGPLLPHPKTRFKNRSTQERTVTARCDGLLIDQLTIGHPQRRGCKACFEMGDDKCSLIEHAHAYPCEACDDAGCDCEFIVPPELKKSCERCKLKRLTCSYRIDGGKGVDTCEACEEDESKCLAGPLKSTGRLIRQNTKPLSSSAAQVQDREYAACNQCRNGGKRCNLKKSQQGPCTKCKSIGEQCTFVLKPTSAKPALVLTPPSRLKSKRKKDNQKHGKNSRHSYHHNGEHTPGQRNGRHETQMSCEVYINGVRRPKSKANRKEQMGVNGKQQKAKARAQNPASDAQGNVSSPGTGYTNLGEHSYMHVRIRTAFSHPISFNYVPDPMSYYPCSWCTYPFFGLFGHGEVEVEVVPYPMINGYGYEEVEGGHSNPPNEKETSKMCVDCTTLRFSIMGCETHVFANLRQDPRHQIAGEMEKSIQALLDNKETGGELAKETKWCSICPTPAAYMCCTRQPTDKNGGEGTGCGIFVCDSCFVLYGKIARDSTDAMQALNRTIQIASKDTFHYEYGVRADAQFLTSNGELRIRMEKNLGVMPVEAEEVAESSEGEEDTEVESIIGRMSQGKRKWCEKQKTVPTQQRPQDGFQAASTAEGTGRTKVAVRERKGPKVQDGPHESATAKFGKPRTAVNSSIPQTRKLDGGSRALIDDPLKGAERSRKRPKTNAFLPSIKQETGPEEKTKGPFKDTREVIVISDDDED